MHGIKNQIFVLNLPILFTCILPFIYYPEKQVIYVIIGTVGVVIFGIALLIVSRTVYKRRIQQQQRKKQRPNSTSSILSKAQTYKAQDTKVNINNNTGGQPKTRKISSSLKDIKRKVSRQQEGINNLSFLTFFNKSNFPNFKYVCVVQIRFVQVLNKFYPLQNFVVTLPLGYKNSCQVNTIRL